MRYMTTCKSYCAACGRCGGANCERDRGGKWHGVARLAARGVTSYTATYNDCGSTSIGMALSICGGRVVVHGVCGAFAKWRSALVFARPQPITNANDERARIRTCAPPSACACNLGPQLTIDICLAVSCCPAVMARVRGGRQPDNAPLDSSSKHAKAHQHVQKPSDFD